MILIAFSVLENPGKLCGFSDQCKTLNCFNRQCRCKTIDESFIPETSECVPRKSLGEMCQYSSECAPKRYLTVEGILKKQENNIECQKKVCSCKNSTTEVSIAYPSKSRICLPANLSLGSECLKTNQCDGPGTYCGLNDSAISVCKCREGWRQSNDKCLLFRKCDSSIVGFNEKLLPGFGCLDNQFCRNGICLCSPMHEFTEEGECKMTTSTKEEHFFQDYGFVIFLAFFCVVVLISILAISHLISKKCKQSRNRFQQRAIRSPGSGYTAGELPQYASGHRKNQKK